MGRKLGKTLVTC